MRSSITKNPPTDNVWCLLLACQPANGRISGKLECSWGQDDDVSSDLSIYLPSQMPCFDNFSCWDHAEAVLFNLLCAEVKGLYSPVTLISTGFLPFDGVDGECSQNVVVDWGGRSHLETAKTHDSSWQIHFATHLTSWICSSINISAITIWTTINNGVGVNGWYSSTEKSISKSSRQDLRLSLQVFSVEPWTTATTTLDL